MAVTPISVEEGPINVGPQHSRLPLRINPGDELPVPLMYSGGLAGRVTNWREDGDGDEGDDAEEKSGGQRQRPVPLGAA
jgi:hypothetical protein